MASCCACCCAISLAGPSQYRDELEESQDARRQWKEIEGDIGRFKEFLSLIPTLTLIEGDAAVGKLKA